MQKKAKPVVAGYTAISYCLVNQHWDVSGVQALCGKSSWGRVSNLQADCPGFTEPEQLQNPKLHN